MMRKIPPQGRSHKNHHQINLSGQTESQQYYLLFSILHWLYPSTKVLQMTCCNFFIAYLFLALATHGSAFTLLNGNPFKIHHFPTSTSLQHSNSGHNEARRSFLNKLAVASFAAPLFPGLVEPAAASGGATAGGAYLLSAKQRYNERVKASVQGLLALESSLKNGDSKPAKAYFENEDGGSWKDLTSAGYLLSNAFRRNSTTPPDSLPAVKVRTGFVE
jgi:hypothetical protein